MLDLPDDNNYNSYIPSAKENSGKSSVGPTGKSRRDIARQPSQELVKSEYQGEQGQVENRPPSRRNNPTPTSGRK